jgi:Mpv17 / PMP22 family
MKPCMCLLLPLLGLVIEVTPAASFPLSMPSSKTCSRDRINNQKILRDRPQCPLESGAEIMRTKRTTSEYNKFASRRHRATGSSTSLQSSLLPTALAAVDTFWKTSPYAAAAIVCGIKASAADFVAQKRQIRKASQAAASEEAAVSATGEAAIPVVPETKTNKMRNLAYLVYGSVYQGVFQEYMYNHVYPALFGSGTDIATVLSKVCFDLFFQTILLTLPMAYLSKALIFRHSVKEAFRRYVDDIRNHGLLTKYFTLWGPVQCITFSIIPEHFRVTFIAGVSFFWLIILSSIASKPRATSLKDGTVTTVPDDCPMEDGQTCELEFNDKSA